MLRIAFIIAALGLGSFAQAENLTKTAPPEVLPVERASSGAFDALYPLIQARLQFENGQFEESYKNYSAVFLHDPNNTDVLFGLAESALASGKGSIASKTYARLAKYKLNTEQSIAQFSGLVLSEIAAGTSENPEARLKQALKTSPNDFRLWNALGKEYDTQRRWSESWRAYQRAAKDGFSQAGLHNNLGMSFLAQKKYQGATSHFKYAAKLAPKNAQFDNNYRFALLMTGNYHAALEDIDETQATNILNDAGYIAIQREEYSLARALLEKAIEISPVYNQRAALNLEKLEARQN